MKKALNQKIRPVGHLREAIKNLSLALIWQVLFGKNWLLYFGVLLTTIWEFFPKGVDISYPLVDHSQKAQWWAYLLGQHLNVICISLFMYRSYKSPLTAAYLIAQVWFVIDYVLRYNYKFHLFLFEYDINFSYNHIMIIIIAVLAWGLKKS